MTNYEKLEKTFPNIPKYSGIDIWGDYWNEEYKELKEEEKQTAEVEADGGWPSWWFGCGECHAMLDTRDEYCKQCGRRLDWSGVYLKKTSAERVPDDLRSEGTEREQEPGEP